MRHRRQASSGRGGKATHALLLMRRNETWSMRRNDIAAREDADKLLWRLATHDRHSPDMLQHHLVGDITERAFLVHHNRRPTNDVPHATRSRVLCIEKVAPRDNANQAIHIVEHREALMRRTTSA